MINYLGTDIININEEEKIVITSNEKNNLFWKEVYFVSGQENYFVGSCFTHKDVIDHNDLYIAILSIEHDKDNNPVFKVKKIFDIINREYIMGTGEELLEFYQFEFLNERQIKTL